MGKKKGAVWGRETLPAQLDVMGYIKGLLGFILFDSSVDAGTL